ncbi:uncharacterized protein LOC117642640 [Thrips palmi]|uniref:Uncharacterized protein LOC117642640 n=1 Tax=Thrips palmi TaxID=161013 RepID=A0A6P8YS49_THRPL|nr:uncharacterized protein LOC117642640 [Thrips palmi]
MCFIMTKRTRVMKSNGLKDTLRSRCLRDLVVVLLLLLALQEPWPLTRGRLQTPRAFLCPANDFLSNFTTLFLRDRSDAASTLVVTLPRHTGDPCPSLLLRRLAGEPLLLVVGAQHAARPGGLHQAASGYLLMGTVDEVRLAVRVLRRREDWTPLTRLLVHVPYHAASVHRRDFAPGVVLRLFWTEKSAFNVAVSTLHPGGNFVFVYTLYPYAERGDRTVRCGQGSGHTAFVGLVPVRPRLDTTALVALDPFPIKCTTGRMTRTS